jgi:Response regulators consisting of a CheY-like receiver domain and a winged-helix DNA-binding domain
MFDEKKPSPEKPDSPNPKILLADDDASLRRFLEVTLQRAGYRTTCAEDGLSALEAALAGDFDCVIADAVMPNMTGFDLCRVLRGNPNYEKVPLIILTGMENASAETENSIADIFLQKNENLKQQLVETLSELLRTKAKN